MTLQDAISAHYEQRAAERQPNALGPDPELEEWGRKLDILRDTDPTEHASPGLAGIRQQVATYRRRKAMHEGDQS